MKRGTPDHPKTHDLAERLELATWGAVGILESLWHWTARFAVTGDIGKFTDAQISRGLGWKGEPVDLINALVDSGWIDESEEHRLVIHDWHDHADDAAKKYVERNGLQFASVNVQKCRDKSRNVEKCPPRACALPEPLPLPLSLPEPKPQVSTEPETAPLSVPPDSVMTFKTTGSKGQEYHLTQTKFDEFKTDFPGVDVLAECRAARAWNENNPSKRKTLRGMPAFLCSWLSRAQNRGPVLSPNHFGKPPPQIPRAIPSVTPLVPRSIYDRLPMAKKQVIEFARRTLRPSEFRSYTNDPAIIEAMKLRYPESAEVVELIKAEIEFPKGVPV